MLLHMFVSTFENAIYIYIQNYTRMHTLYQKHVRSRHMILILMHVFRTIYAYTLPKSGLFQSCDADSISYIQCFLEYYTCIHTIIPVI
jgi:hypothetical protein